MNSRILFIFLYFIISGTGILSQSWSEIETSSSAPALKNHTAVYDIAANRMLVFGGRFSNGSNSNELWSLKFANNQWTQLTPSGSLPSPRYTHNAYYDSLYNRMIIWSGQGAELYNDVWAYNINNNTWTRLWQDGNTAGVPLKRYGTGSVFDPVSRSIVTFAGFTTSGRFDDTWTFHVDSLKWTDRTTFNHPPKRCLHSACYIPELRAMVIFGGQDTGPLDDIWSLNINNFTWEELLPPDIPAARFFYSIIYARSGNLAMFGGLGTAAYGDLWKFDSFGIKWESINQGSIMPAARWGHSSVYIRQSDKMVMFGGEGTVNYNDVWQYTNVSAIGIKPISQNIPDKFILEQNYPNPFNPVTKIKFSLPPASKTGVSENNAVLKIYNATGEETTTLINESLQAGSYEIEWNADGISSGVYFYSLVYGSHKITRKMILLK